MNTTKEKEMKMLFGYMQENTFSWLFKMSQVRQIWDVDDMCCGMENFQ